MDFPGTNGSRRRGAAVVIGALLALAATPAVSAEASGGKPSVERELIRETFFDDYILDLCGVPTHTTVRQRTTVKTFPDGSQTVHVNAEFVPHDQRITSERNAWTDRIAADGTRRRAGSPSASTARAKGPSYETPVGSASWRTASLCGDPIRSSRPTLRTSTG